MRVRALSSQGDWLFGKGLNDYKSGVDAVAQSIQTRLNSFLNDCFFALNAGIDWFNLLGSKNPGAITLAVSTTILNTANVLTLDQLLTNLNTTTRNLIIEYSATTVFGATSENVNVSIPVGA